MCHNRLNNFSNVLFDSHGAADIFWNRISPKSPGNFTADALMINFVTLQTNLNISRFDQGGGKPRPYEDIFAFRPPSECFLNNHGCRGGACPRPGRTVLPYILLLPPSECECFLDNQGAGLAPALSSLVIS